MTTSILFGNEAPAKPKQRVFVYEPATGELHLVPVTQVGARTAHVLPAVFGLLLATMWAVLGWTAAWAANIYGATLLGLVALAMLTETILRRHEATEDPPAGTTLVQRHVTALRALRSRKTIVDAMLKRGLDVLLSFCAVGILCSALQVWVSSRIGTAGATHAALWLEQTAIWLRSINPVTSTLLHLPKWIDLLVVLTLALLSVLLPSMVRVGAWWRQGSQWAVRVYVFLTFLASITFFGALHTNRIEAATAHLNGEIERNRDAYGAASDAVTRVLANAVVIQAASHSPEVQSWNAALDDLFEAGRTEARMRNAVRSHSPAFHERLLRLQGRFAAERPRTSESGRAGGRSGPRSGPVKGARRTPHPSWQAQRVASVETAAARARERTRDAQRSEPFGRVIESAADVLHSQVEGASTMVNLDGGTMGEIVGILLQPLLQVPVKEWLRKTFRSVAESVLSGRQSVDEGAMSVAQLARTELAPPPAGAASVSPLARRLAAFRSEASTLRGEIDRAYDVAVRQRYDHALADFKARVGQTYSTGATSRPVNAFLSAVERDLTRWTDPAERLVRLEERHRQLFNGQEPPFRALLASAEEPVAKARASAIVDALAAAELQAESTGKWGRLRATAESTYRRSAYPQPTRELVITHIRGWHVAKSDIAREAVLVAPGKDLVVNWDLEFFDYFRQDPGLALIWSYLVIADDLTIGRFKPGGATPADGYQHFLRSIGARDDPTLQRLLASEAVTRLNDLLCPK